MPSNGASTCTTSLNFWSASTASDAANPGEADWLLLTRGLAIAYNWPDDNDTAAALLISVRRE